jgi:Lamin Tail Domain/CotH kinase protein
MSRNDQGFCNSRRAHGSRRFFILASAFLVTASASSQSISEPLGPSSRRTPIAISEIMYKPAVRVDGRNTEFIELYNSNPWPEDISGFRLDGLVQFTFPAQTAIGGGGFIVVAAAPADLQAVYGLSQVLGPYTNSLKTSGTVRLYDEQGAKLLDIGYSEAAPWPMGADGTGHSIVLARPSYGEGDPQAWDRSDVVGGSPGSAESYQASPLRAVVLNELLAHTDPPDIDSIELYNHGNVAVNLTGCTLSDDPATNKFVIPANTVIPPRGFVYFTESNLGFGLNAAGETVYFKNPDASRVLDALRFNAQANGIAYGRHPDGAREWYRLSTPTFGTNNAAPLVSTVGINEIMYHPLSGNDDDQYVELFNRGTNAVNLGGWKFVAGITFTFPTNTVLATNGYLVIGRDTLRLLTNYPQLNLNNTVGNFSGKLSGSGERLALAMPDTIVSTNAGGMLITNHVDIVVDEVTYGTGGRWGRWSDGGGSSLELVDARTDKRLAPNWADSDETAKAPWATIETTGVLDNGSGATSPVQLGLLDAGECLVDDIEVRPGTSGSNYAGNPGFENGMTSLSFIGDHSRSSLEANSGYPAGGVALHLRTGDSILTGPNAVQITLTNTSLTSGQTATLRFKARWLRGCPEPLLRFWGCYLEATGRLPVPSNLGTPGLRNSKTSTNAGPAIYQVTHEPAVPAANQPVVVTARVSDPDGLASLTLRYRFDPLTTTTNLVMNDTGVNGDAIAGDGVYSATLPGRPATNAVAFTLIAVDSIGATNRFPELVQDNAPVRECVVFFGEPNPTDLFGTYHLWLTQTNVNRWKALPKMSNEDIDGTLVYNNRVIYNMGGRYSGGPWHQNYDSPAGNRSCHYVWSMPKDDLLLGASAFNQMHWPGNDIQNDTINTMFDDPTLQREQAAYMFLRGVGVPWSYRRFVAVYCNGVRRGKLMEDAYRPTAGTAGDEYFPGDSGAQFYKLQRWYEGSSTALISECFLRQYTTTGGAMKIARYRPNWALKDTPGSLNDFTNVYALITAANAYNQPNYVDLLENVADMENWMRVSAANHAAGNWDCFGSASGQNVDAWISPQHRWTLFTIDFSICLDQRLSSVGLFSMSDPAWQQIIATPKFRRMYCRALNELVNGVMQSSVINPVLDAKYAAFVADGLTPSSPAATKSWIASQRASIISQLAGINAATFTLGGDTFVAASNTVTLTGTAPVEVVALSINGEAFTPVWNSVTNWSLCVPVPTGTNIWPVVAFDRFGNVVGDTNLVTVANSLTPQSPAGNIVINEIMFNPTRPGAEYVELFNAATNTAFDLSGWGLNGLAYTFPSGSTLAPRSYLLLAKSRVVFAATYGALTPVFEEFAGTLQPDGETLSLIQPGVAPALDLVVDRVRYETNAPWPLTAATRPGTSLQLVDAAQDNSRVANWAVGRTNPPAIALATPGTTNSVRTALPPFPMLWLNEVQPDNLTGPMDNFNEHDPWIELYNPGNDPVSLAGLYLGTNYTSPMQWAFPADASIAPGQFLVVWLDGQPAQTSGAILHAGFRFVTGSVALSRFVDGVPQIVDYLNFAALPANYSYGDVPDGQPFYRQAMFRTTPAGTNNAALPPITVSINEWMAENTGYLLNPGTGKYDDWFELYNPAATPAELAGYYLTDTLTNKFQYQIPAGYRVPAQGFLLVWADGETSANSTNSPNLHVPFKLAKDGEAIGLFTPDGAAIDAVAFDAQTSNLSEGRYPDGGGLRLFMTEPSPGSPNLLSAASGPPVVIGVSLQPDNSFALTLQTSPGHSYRVEFKDNLNDATWLPLGPVQMATESTLTVSDSAGGPQRFYRITMVE